MIGKLQQEWSCSDKGELAFASSGPLWAWKQARCSKVPERGGLKLRRHFVGFFVQRWWLILHFSPRHGEKNIEDHDVPLIPIEWQSIQSR